MDATANARRLAATRRWLGRGDKPHFDQEARRRLSPATILRRSTQNEALFCPSDCDKAITSFLFHFRALTTFLLALKGRQDVVRETDYIDVVEFLSFRAMYRHQSDCSGL